MIQFMYFDSYLNFCSTEAYKKIKQFMIMINVLKTILYYLLRCVISYILLNYFLYFLYLLLTSDQYNLELFNLFYNSLLYLDDTGKLSDRMQRINNIDYDICNDDQDSFSYTENNILNSDKGINLSEFYNWLKIKLGINSNFVHSTSVSESSLSVSNSPITSTLYSIIIPGSVTLSNTNIDTKITNISTNDSINFTTRPNSDPISRFLTRPSHSLLSHADNELLIDKLSIGFDLDSFYNLFFVILHILGSVISNFVNIFIFSIDINNIDYNLDPIVLCHIHILYLFNILILCGLIIFILLVLYYWNIVAKLFSHINRLIIFSNMVNDYRISIIGFFLILVSLLLVGVYHETSLIILLSN